MVVVKISAEPREFNSHAVYLQKNTSSPPSSFCKSWSSKESLAGCSVQNGVLLSKGVGFVRFCFEHLFST